MDISTITTRITLEIQAFFAAPDRRAHLHDRLDRIYTETIQPLDLPGPDRVIDPMLRASMLWVAMTAFDAIAAAVQKGQTIAWAAAPATETTEEVQP